MSEPIETVDMVIFGNEVTLLRYREHDKDCTSYCPCCIYDYDCSCGAITIVPLNKHQ